MIPHTIVAPRIPLYQMGTFDLDDRVIGSWLGRSVNAPRVPLYQLGWLGVSTSQIVAPAASVASTIPAAIAAGSWAGPIGAGVAALGGLIAGLLAAHALRAKQAKDENSAMNIGVQGFDSDLRMVQSDFNAGNIDANGASQAVQVILQNYWALVTPHIQPGRNGCNGGGSCPASAPANYCSGSIGAACCVGCADLSPSINGPTGVLAAIAGANGGIAQILKVFGSKYGGNERGAYTLTFKAPPPVAAPTVNSIVSAIESPLTSLVNAISPSGTTGASGGSSLLPLVLLGAAAWFLLR